MKKLFSILLVLFSISFVFAKNELKLDSSGIKNDTTKNLEIYDFAEVMPEFPGGKKELIKFLSLKIKFPSVARESGFQGKVVVKFHVDIDGKVKEPIIIKNSGCIECEAEVLKVINSFPKWSPGISYGKPVKVFYTLPVTFALESGVDVNNREAIFKGGEDGLLSFIKSTSTNIKLTTKLIKTKNKKYNATISFNISENGSTTNPVIISTNIDVEEAIEKLINAVSKTIWYPALKDGNAIISSKEFLFEF